MLDSYGILMQTANKQIVRHYSIQCYCMRDLDTAMVDVLIDIEVNIVIKAL